MNDEELKHFCLPNFSEMNNYKISDIVGETPSSY